MRESDIRLRQLAGIAAPSEAPPPRLRVIGQSIHEAIDWTQDRLQTTRPLAERVLFNLLHEETVLESPMGFVLQEDKSDDEEMRKHLRSIRTTRPRAVRSHRRARLRPKRRLKKIIKPDLSPDVDDVDDDTAEHR
jgi:hypothetical protein